MQAGGTGNMTWKLGVAHNIQERRGFSGAVFFTVEGRTELCFWMHQPYEESWGEGGGMQDI